nr:putative disease resistance protein [Quercus suber]
MLEWEEWVSSDVEGEEFPCLQELSIRRCPKLRENLPKQFPLIEKFEISESQELVTTLTTQASIHKRLLHYHDKVMFMSDDKVVSFSKKMTIFTSEGVVESSSPMTEGATECPVTQTQTSNNQDGMQGLSSFESMKVSEISQLLELLLGLQNLKIEGCDTLEFIPKEVMDRISSLQHLYIINFCSLKSFQGHPPASLKSLYIQNCKEFKFLPPAEKTDQYEELEYLCIGNSCDSLISLPLSFFPNLRTLSI